jgi:hypothetical protein
MQSFNSLTNLLAVSPAVSVFSAVRSFDGVSLDIDSTRLQQAVFFHSSDFGTPNVGNVSFRNGCCRPKNKTRHHMLDHM